MGHVAHFPKTLLSWVPTRVLFTMIPLLKGGLGAEFPVGLSFSTKEDIAKAVAYNGMFIRTARVGAPWARPQAHTHTRRHTP